MKNKKLAAAEFTTAVGATQQIAGCLRNGLQGLGAHSNKIQLGDTTKCEGSVDLDGCTTALYPQENRWDYFFGYKSEVFFIEVHSANTGEVSTVLRKLQWLKDWLNNHGVEINKLKAKNQPAYYWVQSKGCHIPKTSPQYRQAVQKGLKPVANVILP